MEPNSELKRVIGPGTALALVIANMVGTGIFTTSGFIVQYLGDPLVLLVCWAVGGLVAETHGCPSGGRDIKDVRRFQEHIRRIRGG